jgi:hypothetical protein
MLPLPPQLNPIGLSKAVAFILSAKYGSKEGSSLILIGPGEVKVDLADFDLK